MLLNFNTTIETFFFLKLYMKYIVFPSVLCCVLKYYKTLVTYVLFVTWEWVRHRA